MLEHAYNDKMQSCDKYVQISPQLGQTIHALANDGIPAEVALGPGRILI